MNIQMMLNKYTSILLLALLAGGCNTSKEDGEQKDTSLLMQNKAVVKEFVNAMRLSDVDQLKTMITDDFSWWIIGKPSYIATGGEHDRAYFLGFFKGDELFPDGMEFKVTSMVAEGSSVAAEAEIKANTAMGSYYENYYHFLFVVEDGKIKRMKEYMDTYHAKETFGL